jgi:hypothetical protein
MSTIEPGRDLAIRQLKARNDFKIHLLVYLIINGISVLGWAVREAGQPLPAGFFWPVFLIVGWGIGLVAHGYVVYRRNANPEG